MPAKAKVPKQKSRVRKARSYKSFTLSKKIKPSKPLPGPIKLLKQSFRVVFSNKKIFIGFVLFGGILGWLLVQGFGSSINFTDLKQSTEEILGQQGQNTSTNLVLLAELVGSSGANTGQVAGVYQTALTIVLSLAIIWALRQIQAGEKISLRNTFYKGMYPLIPFILVLLVIGLQLIPLLLGNIIFSAVFAGGLAVTALETILWIAIVTLLSLLSIYMIMSSIMALYIVTLPDMTPMKALRSARGLVMHRRMSVAVRLLFLLIILGIIMVLVILPLIFIWPVVVEASLYLVSSFLLVLTHSYIYSLYRSLL